MTGTRSIGTEVIGGYLERLSAREPTPGGGAAGALHAAQAAALIAMVARYSTGPRYADHAAACADIVERADAGRAAALRLADDDEAAFQAVIDAYGLPKSSPEQATARTAAIQQASFDAAAPPRALIALAAEIVALGERVAAFGNPNVISDVAAAAEAARAAAATGRVNIDINLRGLTDPDQTAALQESLTAADAAMQAAETLSARVREQLRS